MLMMNQPGAAAPAPPAVPAPPAGGPPRPTTGVPGAAGAAGPPSKLKGTMVGVAPPISGAAPGIRPPTPPAMAPMAPPAAPAYAAPAPAPLLPDRRPPRSRLRSRRAASTRSAAPWPPMAERSPRPSATSRLLVRPRTAHRPAVRHPGSARPVLLPGGRPVSARLLRVASPRTVSRRRAGLPRTELPAPVATERPIPTLSSLRPTASRRLRTAPRLPRMASRRPPLRAGGVSLPRRRCSRTGRARRWRGCRPVLRPAWARFRRRGPVPAPGPPGATRS